MARAIRMDYPETYYHVLSRGNEKKEIFLDKGDYLKFLALLGKLAARFHLEIHAYVLMANHYHLLLRTKEANLSSAIQWLGVSYSVWFNRRHKRSGHLFQGRFKSFLIENERYFCTMGFYLHGNPLRAGKVKRLKDYFWSSYGGYSDRRKQPDWLTTDLMLGIYGNSRRKFMRAQEEFFRRGEDVLGNLRHGLYLGSEEFSKECLERLKGEDYRERPQMRSLLRGRDLRNLTLEVLGKLGEREPEAILKRGRRSNRGRDLGMYVLYQLGVYRNQEIGRVFGVGYTAVTNAVKRGERYLALGEQLDNIVKKIIDDK
jgi:putative transposase